MKAETLLDSVVFQLTPTRTRYDLVIIANGKTEKIASGLLDSFLAHLKTAKDQIDKGGYSIRLEPDPGTDSTWFIKDTVERFVRYVSTPEVLERVNTLELEILQINEAIAIQVDDHQSRWTGSMKGSRYAQNGGKEKAMILSKHGKHRRLSTGSITQEENSRRQLLRVLESRKSVLRKEQGMAFARAAAAGFDMDHMANLILFAKSFGAFRLLEACLRFVDLWKVKHNNGQWLEGVGAEVVPFKSESISIRASGIIFSEDDKEKHINGICPVSNDDLATESNVKDFHTSTSNTEDKRLRDQPALMAPQYSHGQIQNPMLPQWLSHGPPVSQSYPVQGLSYYHGYPTRYPPVDDPGFSIEMGLERHSMDKVYSNESKAWEMEIPSTISKIRVHQNETGGRESRKKAGHSGKRRSSMVVGNNVKHITSEGSDESRSQSASDVDAEEEIQDLQSDIPSKKHRNLSRSVNKNGGSASVKTSNTAGKDQVVDGQEGDAGNWQTFQKLLLRVQTENRSADRDMFSSEEAQVRRRGNRSQADPSIPPARTNGDSQELRIVGNHTESRGGGYCRVKNDDFLINRMKQGSSNRSLNPISQDEYQNASNLHKSSLCNASDESFIVPFRSGLHDELAKDKKTVWDMTSDFQSARKNSGPFSRTKNQHNYEPHNLSMMPEHGLEKGYRGFDPAKEFDIQIPVQNSIKKEPRSQGDISKRPREGLKGSGMERKSSSVQYGFEKRKMDPVTMRGKSSKLNPRADAKARAEKLRTFKADLQKAKKEKEEEERKRLEALKLERLKRIAARSNSKVAQLSHNALQTKARKPTNHSPNSGHGSKFRDATPTSSSPLHKMPSSSKSPLTPQKIGDSVSPKPSPSSYKGSKFSDAEPATTSPLVKLLRSSKNISQSACKTQESTLQNQTRVYPSSPPIKKLLHSSNVAQSPSNSRDTAAQKSTRLSSSKGSKFSSTSLSFSSPLQKLPTGTSSASSLDSHKIAKPNRSSGSTHLTRNGSRQSTSPVSRLKKESNDVLPRANTVQFQAKKVSDPQGSKLHPTSVKPVNSNQMPKKTMTKVSHAQSTTSIRTGTSRELCGEVTKSQGKTSMIYQRMLPKRANEAALALNDNEDDQIVEKAVLTVENKTIPDPVIRVSDEMVDSTVRSCEGGRRARIEFVSEHPALHVPPMLLSAGVADNFSDCKPDKKSSSYEVVNLPKDASQKSPNSIITEIPNQAPFARASYVEESTASEIELIEEHIDQKVGSERVRRACKTMDSTSVEQIHGVHEKPHNRGSPRGFKELLKFRRKGQSSASSELNADGSAVNICSATTVPNNTPTLKDLVSKDGHSEGTPPKASRPFSLFPPFHNKSSKKKAGALGAHLS